MKVSVVIPAYNEAKYIGKCLESIVNQKVQPDEIIIVDNNCTDKTPEIAKKFGARIVKEEKQGMISARNTGFNSANYEIIARTDADAILPKDWISKIKEHFKDPNLGALSGPASYFDVPLMSQVSTIATFILFKTIGFLLGHPMLFGPNIALRKSSWEKIKNDICLSDIEVHEDVDLAIHLSKITNIKFDRNFAIRTTRGRWTRILTEYIARFIKMLLSHRVESGSGRK